MAERIPVFWDFNNIKLKQAQRELDRTRAKTRQLQKSANVLSQQFKTLGTTIISSFGAIAVLAVFRNILKSLKDLEFQMSKVAAISGATSKQMIELRKNAIKVGAASKFTATEVGKLQEELARLGFTASEIVKLTDSIAALAIVADTQLGPTALAVAKTINAFSLSALDADRVTNVMAESFANTALTLEKFEAAIRNVGPAAKVAGLTLEETTAILGVLVDNGIEASKAGTDLRRILININRAGLTLDEALDILNDSTDKIGTAFDLFGARALVAGNILAANVQKTKDLNEQFSDSTREMDRMRRIMEDNLETDLKKMASAFDALTQKGSVLNKGFRLIVQSLTEMFRGNLTANQIIADRIRILDEEIAANKEEEETLKNIAAAVKEAFDSEDIEAFITALEGDINKEEIVAQIRRRQKNETQALRLEEERLLEIRKQAFKILSEQATLQRMLEGEELGITREEEFGLLRRLLGGDLGQEEELDQMQETIDEANEIFGEGEEEMTDKADEEIKKRKKLRQEELDNEIRIMQARQVLAAEIFNASEALTGGLIGLAKEGSTAQLALLAFEKAVAITRVIILGQQEKALIRATIPPPVSSALVAAATFRQIASLVTIAATSIPEFGGFKEGVIDYQGQGTSTSDSNLVRISKGESVIKASATAKHKELLESINSGRINEELSSILSEKQIGIDNNDLVAAMLGVDSSIKKLPIHQTYFNEKGVSNYILKEHSRVKKLRSKYING